MRFLYVAVLALTTLLAPVSARLIDASGAAEEFLREGEWKSFKQTYDKMYASAEEEEMRFQLFQENMARNAEMSKLNPEATFGVTRFSDLSQAEFEKYYLGYRPKESTVLEMHNTIPVKKCAMDVDAAAGDVDWRTSGAVSPVKDQGQCGSCWAFSAVEGVESAWFLKHNTTMPILAPQQVVDCDPYDGGCDGGDLPTAFKYIQATGLTTEKAYPYTSGSSGETGTCQKFTTIAANINGSTYATTPCYAGCGAQDEATLLANLRTTGPASICVDASSWNGYTGGVLSSGCSHAYGSLDHCVQLVGYSSSGTTPYWIVRNSWGTSWGQKGYIYLKYGTNTCGVADEAMFVTAA